MLYFVVRLRQHRRLGRKDIHHILHPCRTKAEAYQFLFRPTLVRGEYILIEAYSYDEAFAIAHGVKA